MPITGRDPAGETGEVGVVEEGMAGARWRRLAVSFNSPTSCIRRMRLHGPAGFDDTAERKRHEPDRHHPLPMHRLPGRRLHLRLPGRRRESAGERRRVRLRQRLPLHRGRRSLLVQCARPGDRCVIARSKATRPASVPAIA
jgi:hypothetical protein